MPHSLKGAMSHEMICVQGPPFTCPGLLQPACAGHKFLVVTLLHLDLVALALLTGEQALHDALRQPQPYAALCEGQPDLQVRLPLTDKQTLLDSKAARQMRAFIVASCSQTHSHREGQYDALVLQVEARQVETFVRSLTQGHGQGRLAQAMGVSQYAAERLSAAICSAWPALAAFPGEVGLLEPASCRRHAP